MHTWLKALVANFKSQLLPQFITLYFKKCKSNKTADQKHRGQ